DEHAERKPAFLGKGRVLDLAEHDSTKKWEEGVRCRVGEEGDASGTRMERVDERTAKTDCDGRGGPEQRHGQNEAEERAGDPGSLGFQSEKVRAPGKYGQQADELWRVPLLRRRQQHGRGEA